MGVDVLCCPERFCVLATAVGWYKVLWAAKCWTALVSCAVPNKLGIWFVAFGR